MSKILRMENLPSPTNNLVHWDQFAKFACESGEKNNKTFLVIIYLCYKVRDMVMCIPAFLQN